MIKKFSCNCLHCRYTIVHLIQRCITGKKAKACVISKETPIGFSICPTHITADGRMQKLKNTTIQFANFISVHNCTAALVVQCVGRRLHDFPFFRPPLFVHSASPFDYFFFANQPLWGQNLEKFV